MSIRSTMTIPFFGLVVALAACSGGSVTNSGGDTSETAQTSAAVTQATAAVGQAATTDVAAPAHIAGMHRAPPGPDFLLHAALHEPINLTDAQKATIQTAIDDARPKAPPADFAARSKALAAAVRSGKVDQAVFAPPANDDFHAARQAASAKALSTLFTTLTKDQRVALIDAISKHEGDHHGKEARKEGGRHDKMDHGGPMGGLLEGLNLTDAQKTALHASFQPKDRKEPTEAEKATWKAEHLARKTEMQARLQTFTGDSFDAVAFVARPAGEKGFGRHGDHGDHMGKMLSTLVPLLDATQRETLAQKLEQGPPQRPVAKTAVETTALLT